MYDRRPDVSDEDLGIRAFHIKRAKAVERAIERIRHGLGPMWAELTDSEIEEIEWVLGELWTHMIRAEWEDVAFGRLSMGDLVRIMSLGSELRRHSRPSTEILHDVEKVVKSHQTETPGS